MAKPRIIGGVAKGRTIDIPRRGTRPSPSRLREALFDILAFHERGNFLDLFSGSGAVGLEAASRGWRVTCIDNSREATTTIQHNARRLHLSVTVIQDDAMHFITAAKQRFSVIFAAPPYSFDLRKIFQDILASNIGTLYIFQHPSQLELVPGDTPTLHSTRSYGSNALSIF